MPSRTRTRQLGLALRTRSSWGGRRDGAGRKPGDGLEHPHRSRARFQKLPAHVTLRVRPGLPSLRAVAVVHEIERTFAKGCTRPGFRLVHYSLQGNHAHLVVEARNRETLGRGMMAITCRLARAVNRVARRTGPVLADRYHLRLLPTPKEVRNALRYVLLNTRRHTADGRKLSGHAEIDRASSGRWFDGWRSIGSSGPKAASPPARPPVARPRTWLLAIGWRRHGLLDPADVPGPPVRVAWRDTTKRPTVIS
jgi:hypothetical protein